MKMCTTIPTITTTTTITAGNSSQQFVLIQPNQGKLVFPTTTFGGLRRAAAIFFFFHFAFLAYFSPHCCCNYYCICRIGQALLYNFVALQLRNFLQQYFLIQEMLMMHSIVAQNRPANLCVAVSPVWLQ